VIESFIMEDIDKIKRIRELTQSPILAIKKALEEVGGAVEKAIDILLEQKTANAQDMANRKANNNTVYSYVHNHRVGAMITISSQTDFVSKNEVFLQLAKDICMHIVSTPTPPQYINETDISLVSKEKVNSTWVAELNIANKPENVQAKILQGKWSKYVKETCLMNQNFIKDDTLTIQELINRASSTLGEKIELKRFTRHSA
jgi:elongation factor Ts